MHFCADRENRTPASSLARTRSTTKPYPLQQHDTTPPIFVSSAPFEMLYNIKMTHERKLLIIQALVLFGGTVFAWSNFLPQISRFQSLYGTIFKFTGCTVPNPFLTACFLGSFAFLVALLWSFSIYQSPNPVRERHLRNFLLLCVIFATSVIAYETAQYYKFIASAVSVSCNPGASPFTTPCFYGDIFFIVAFIISVFAVRRFTR